MAQSTRTFAGALIGVLLLIGGAIAHEAIDLAGDVLLAHDTYDGLAHDSRLAFAAVGASLLCCFVLGYVICIADRRHHGFDLAAVARRFLRRRGILTFALCGGTLAIVPVMERIDASSAGRPIAGIANAYGGSMLLGPAACLIVALALALLTIVTARWLCSNELRICGIIVHLLNKHTATVQVLSFHALPEHPTAFGSTPIARKRALRAPPPILA